MRNRFILLLTIAGLMSLLLGSGLSYAGYYKGPDIPDYDITSVPCHEHQYRSSTVHSHHKHHPVSVVHHTKSSHYSISKYYVYSSGSGDLIWVPSPCDCSGTWVKVPHVKSDDEFSYEFHQKTGQMDYDVDDTGSDMDTRTGDDVYNEY